ncbi:MAG: hypothetical protein M3Y51_02660 [Actinomycetota bacterium]|nr:hypothetical protein [Actinomycetota bacterium]
MSEPTEPIEPPSGPAAKSSDSSNATVVGLVIVVLLGALALVAILMFRDQNDDEVVTGDDGVETTAPEPDVTEPEEPVTSEPLGADSPLVGMTELEVRERYVSVRVVEVDGEPLPATMDLQPGRINLALEGDTVVGATVEGCDELGDDAAPWMAQACDPDPDSDGPNASGKLLADPAGGDELTLEVGTQGDQYHQGMTVRPASDETIVRTTDGTPLTADELRPDDVVFVWTGACRESSPVQCDIHAIVVDRG